MKDGYRFVDCDMHIMEPPDLFDKYLDPAFKPRVTSAIRRSVRGPLVSKRANQNVMFAVERGYDAEAQLIGMQMEGIDIAVLFPTAGLSFLARDHMDPQFSAAICRAYNDWLHEFCQYSPDQLKMRRCCRCTTSTWPARSSTAASSSTVRSALSCGRTASTAASGIRPVGIRSTACCRSSTCRCAFTRAPARTIRRSSRALARTASCATSPATRSRCSWR